jgi:AraC-like DNA-binding protein
MTLFHKAEYSVSTNARGTRMAETNLSEWLQSVIRNCQVFVLEALPAGDRPLRNVLSEFVDRLPSPRTMAEDTVLRGLLIDVSFRWGIVNHCGFHRNAPIQHCGFNSDQIAVEAWRPRQRDSKTAFASWAQCYADQFERSHPAYLAAALRRHLDVFFASPVSIKGLAQQHRTTSARLQNEFTQLTGRSIQAYVRQRRVEAAIRLLETTPDKVESIANMVGWASRKNLNRALARLQRATPLSIRKRRPERP